MTKSALGGQYPICRVWLYLFDDVLVAAETGDLTKLGELLEKNACCTEEDIFGRTPFYLAVLSGRKDVVEMLLDHGVDVSIIDSKGQTPLHFAAQQLTGGILELLVARGAYINATDKAQSRSPPAHIHKSAGPSLQAHCEGGSEHVVALYGVRRRGLHWRAKRHPARLWPIAIKGLVAVPAARRRRYPNRLQQGAAGTRH